MRFGENQRSIISHPQSKGQEIDRKEVTIHAKVFVGNLSYDTTQTELESLFSEVGQVVEVFLPADRNTGRPRGFAFVEFTEEDSAAKAIRKFDGYAFKDRNLHVNQAEDRPRRPPGLSDAGPPAGRPGSRRPRPKGSRRNIRGRKRML